MTLGNGCYGTVYLVKYDDDSLKDNLYAMKLLDK